MDLINQNIKPIQALCLRYNVAQLYVFGSILTKDFNKESDIDFVVDFNEIALEAYADNYFDLKLSLEKLLKRDIDLLEKKAIKNPFLKSSIDSSKELIYG